MKVDRLPIVTAPHHGRVLQKLSAMETPMTSSRKAEGVRFKFGNWIGNHLTRLLSRITDPFTAGS